MRDEYIPAFLELAKAMTDKTLLADLEKYQKVKSESDAAFKANEKRVVELQFDRNQLENEKAALAKDKAALEVAKAEMVNMAAKAQAGYQEASKLRESLSTELAAQASQRASLATAEAATTKAPRRIPVGIMAWPIAAAVGAPPTGGDIVINFDSPIYVNPGEFFAFVAKFIIGTATASQVIWGTATVIHSWE